MGYHYAPSTKGFYHDDIHGDQVPGDAIPLTDADYQRLLSEQSSGLVITVAGGQVVTAPREQVIPFDQLKAEAMEHVRGLRATLLQQLDGEYFKAVEQGKPITEIVAKKQRLRDIPALVAAAMTPAELAAIKASLAA